MPEYTELPPPHWSDEFVPVTRAEIRRQLDNTVRRVLAEQLPERVRLAVQMETTDIESHILAIEENITRLGERVSSAEDAAYARAGELVGLIKAEFASLKGQLDAALADKDAAVAAALNDDSAADAERVSGLISELESVLPAEVPEVPVPDPGQPAEPVPAPEPEQPV